MEDQYHYEQRQRRGKGTAKPWQIGFHTPNTRLLLRAAKGHYRGGILFNNAYPGDELRARNARASWEFAIRQNPDVFVAGK